MSGSASQELCKEGRPNEIDMQVFSLVQRKSLGILICIFPKLHIWDRVNQPVPPFASQSRHYFNCCCFLSNLLVGRSSKDCGAIMLPASAQRCGMGYKSSWQRTVSPKYFYSVWFLLCPIFSVPAFHLGVALDQALCDPSNDTLHLSMLTGCYGGFSFMLGAG